MGLKKTKGLSYTKVDVYLLDKDIHQLRKWCYKTFGGCHYLGPEEKILPYVWYQIFVKDYKIARFYFANPGHAAWFKLQWE